MSPSALVEPHRVKDRGTLVTNDELLGGGGGGGGGVCIAIHWETFCSAQFTGWYLCARKSPNALHACFSEISPTLHLKQFQCSSD